MPRYIDAELLKGGKETNAPVTAESAIRAIQEAAKEYAEQQKKIGRDEDVLFRLQLGRTMDL